MKTPDAVFVELLAAAGINLEHDDPYWYAVDARSAEPLAAGSDAGRVAREALLALRRRLDDLEVAERSRSVGGAA